MLEIRGLNLKSESISKIFADVETGLSVGWFPTKSGELICWKKDSNTSEITIYECVGGTLKGSTLNSPVKLNVERKPVSSSTT